MLQFTTAFEEARLLHPGDSGWFAIMRRLPDGKVMSKMHPMAHLDIVTKATERAPDIFLSQSSFSANKRRITAFANVRAAWVDIDCYNFDREPDRSLIDEIVDRCVQVGLPKPTYMIRSGRGLYAKWLFREEMGPANLPVWNALQRSLCATFKAIGADVRARDIARVLRPVGSINSKAPEAPVHLVWCNTDLVDFDHLCLAAAEVRIEPTEQEKIAQMQRLGHLRTANRARRELADLLPSITHLDHLDRYTQTREPILMAAQERSLRALHWRRFTDLRQLAHLRGGIHRGSRDNFMFWMMVSLANCGVVTRQNFFDELADLSKSIASDDYQPLQDGSMGSLYDRVGLQTLQGKAAVYTPSNAKLIDLLEITEQEQQHLSTLISPAEKRRRTDERCPGRQQRREELHQARRLVMDLLEQGSTAAQAADRAGVDRRQVYRWQQAAQLKKHCPKATARSGRALPVRARQAEKGHIVGQVADMLARKRSRAEICMSLGLSESAWYRICKSIRRCGLHPDQLPGHAGAPSPQMEQEEPAQQMGQVTQLVASHARGHKPTSVLARLRAQAGADMPDVLSQELRRSREQARQQAQILSQQAASLIQKAHALERAADQANSGVSLQATLDHITQRLRSRGIAIKATLPELDPRHAHDRPSAQSAGALGPGRADAEEAIQRSPDAMKAVLDLRRRARQARHEAEQLFSKLNAYNKTTLDTAPAAVEDLTYSVRNLLMSDTVAFSTQAAEQGREGAGAQGANHGGANTTGPKHASGPPGGPAKGSGSAASQAAGRCGYGAGDGAFSDPNFFAGIFAQIAQRRHPGTGRRERRVLLAGQDPDGTAS